jgi:hypothetical protein
LFKAITSNSTPLSQHDYDIEQQFCAVHQFIRAHNAELRKLEGTHLTAIEQLNPDSVKTPQDDLQERAKGIRDLLEVYQHVEDEANRCRGRQK